MNAADGDAAGAPPRYTSPPPRISLPLPLPHGAPLVLGGRTLVMGIVNATPDSFSDGGHHAGPDAALAHAERLIADGADLLDIGGESTRPGADEVPADEQARRILPVIRALAARHAHVPISVDTRNAEVAARAVDAGASIVNDVSGLAHDPAMRATVAASGAPAIVMHMRGTPADMRERTAYDDVVGDVLRETEERLAEARAAGIAHLIADPGIGFAKTAEQSAALLAATPRFVERLRELGVPLMIGPSRKSFLALATGERAGPPAETRAAATIAAVTTAALLGAHIVRVHDVAPACDAVRLVAVIRDSAGWTSGAGAARMSAV